MTTMRSSRHHPPADSSRKLVRKNEATSWRWQSFSFREDAVMEEPISPKVGCMGQIRKEKMSTSVAKASGTNHKFFKLKKMFSGKSFGHGTTKTSQGDKVSVVLPVDLPLELHPPLPVNRTGSMNGVGGVPVSLWKRRCWIKLERLQLQNLTPRLHCSGNLSA